jgi:hypothetical protein
LQVKPQVPPVHVGVPLVTAGHLLPQALQFWRSDVSSTHAPPQKLWPEGQPDTHWAPSPESVPPSTVAQTGVPASALHAPPQNPQLVEVLKTAQVFLQREKPSLHEMVHLLLTHAAEPFGSLVEHTLPPSGLAQPPQFVAVLVISTQEPLQTAWPVGQPLLQR